MDTLSIKVFGLLDATASGEFAIGSLSIIVIALLIFGWFTRGRR